MISQNEASDLYSGNMLRGALFFLHDFSEEGIQLLQWGFVEGSFILTSWLLKMRCSTFTREVSWGERYFVFMTSQNRAFRFYNGGLLRGALFWLPVFSEWGIQLSEWGFVEGSIILSSWLLSIRHPDFTMGACGGECYSVFMSSQSKASSFYNGSLWTGALICHHDFSE